MEALGGEMGELLLTLPPVSLARADLEVDLGLGAGQLVLTERLSRPELGRGSALSGVLVDAGSGDVVVGAVVRVGERSGVTDAAGRFTLERLAAGAQVLEVEHVAYGRWTEALALEAGAESVVRGELEARPIALGALEVEAAQRREVLSPRVSATSRRVIRGADLAEAQRRGAQVAGLIRERFPGLNVIEMTRAGMTTGICVESNRRIMSLSPSQVSGCDMVPIIIDGMQIQDAGSYLRQLRVDDFESIEFVSAIDAQILYGLRAGAAGGALVFWNRGRGRGRASGGIRGREPCWGVTAASRGRGGRAVAERVAWR